MVTVVNKSQQVYTAGLNPRSAYSRVMVFNAIAVPPVIEDYIYSPPCGNKVRLLRVKATLAHHNDEVNFGIEVILYCGEGKPGTANALRQWEEVIPVYRRIGDRFIRTDRDTKDYEWSMNRLFVGHSLRFGVIMMSVGTLTAKAMVSIEISEG